MDPAVQKAISLILIIGFGILIKNRFSPQAIVGIRTLILNAALPATILVSFLGVDASFNIWTPSIYAVIANLILLVSGFFIVKMVLFDSADNRRKSVLLLFPSLAPGLTTYPFIQQYLGAEGLAWAALADIGNKIFVLIGLYSLAFHWGQKLARSKEEYNWQQIKQLLLTLCAEPVNIAMVIGIICVSFGIKIPDFLKESATIISNSTTSLILLFIGISVQFNIENLKTIGQVLIGRVGIGLMIGGSALWVASFFDIIPFSLRQLLVVVPLAGCSLWPFLHSHKTNAMLDDRKLDMLITFQHPSSKTPFNRQYVLDLLTQATTAPLFDTDFALALLTLSFPASIMIVLGIFSVREAALNPTILWAIGLICVGIVIALQSNQFIKLVLSGVRHACQAFQKTVVSALPGTRYDHRDYCAFWDPDLPNSLGDYFGRFERKSRPQDYKS